MKRDEMYKIIDNYVNGNLKDMTWLIDEYGLYDFFADLKSYIVARYNSDAFDAYSAIVIAYHRIKYR